MLDYVLRASLNPEVGLPDGSAQMRKQRIHAVGVRVHRSNTFKVGPDTANLETVAIRTTTDPMGVAVPLFTGDREVKAQNKWQRNSQIIIQTDQPTPLTVVSLVKRFSVNEA